MQSEPEAHPQRQRDIAALLARGLSRIAKIGELKPRSNDTAVRGDRKIDHETALIADGGDQ